MRAVSPFRLTTLATLLVPLGAHATNGYFSDGYGAISEGQGGVGIAWSQDALAPATNPAGLAFLNDRLDLGITLFHPQRGAQINGNAFGPDQGYEGNSTENFLIPEFGYVRRISDSLYVGIAVFGNGGLNTDYQSNPYARFGASGSAGVNLEQLFISPAIAWKPAPDESIGIALNIADQRFSAKGLSVFSGFSSNPSHVSDQGTDSSVGTGVRIGWSGVLAPGLTGGVTWSSRISGQFSDYRGLFANGGEFDIPENYGAGLAYQINRDWKIATDVQEIRYSQVAAVGDSLEPLLQGVPLGATNGPGFGWRDITVYKIGSSYKISGEWEVRAGYSHAQQPIPQNQTFLNILAPGVVQDTYTLGATWTQVSGNALTGFLAYAPLTTVNGAGSIPPGLPPAGFGGGNANIHLKETILGVSYSWKL